MLDISAVVDRIPTAPPDTLQAGQRVLAWVSPVMADVGTFQGHSDGCILIDFPPGSPLVNHGGNHINPRGLHLAAVTLTGVDTGDEVLVVTPSVGRTVGSDPGDVVTVGQVRTNPHRERVGRRTDGEHLWIGPCVTLHPVPQHEEPVPEPVVAHGDLDPSLWKVKVTEPVAGHGFTRLYVTAAASDSPSVGQVITIAEDRIEEGDDEGPYRGSWFLRHGNFYRGSVLNPPVEVGDIIWPLVVSSVPGAERRPSRVERGGTGGGGVHVENLPPVSNTQGASLNRWFVDDYVLMEPVAPATTEPRVWRKDRYADSATVLAGVPAGTRVIMTQYRPGDHRFNGATGVISGSGLVDLEVHGRNWGNWTVLTEVIDTDAPADSPAVGAEDLEARKAALEERWTRLWEVSGRVAEEQEWCGEYERVVTSIGGNPRDGRDEYGDEIDEPEEDQDYSVTIQYTFTLSDSEMDEVLHGTEWDKEGVDTRGSVSVTNRVVLSWSGTDPGENIDVGEMLDGVDISYDDCELIDYEQA